MRDDGKPVSFETAFMREIGSSYVVGNITSDRLDRRLAVAARREGEPRAARPRIKTHVIPRSRRAPAAPPHSARGPTAACSRRRSRATTTPRAASRRHRQPPCSSAPSCRTAAVSSRGRLAGRMSCGSSAMRANCSTRRSSETPVAGSSSGSPSRRAREEAGARRARCASSWSSSGGWRASSSATTARWSASWSSSTPCAPTWSASGLGRRAEPGAASPRRVR